MAPSPSGSFQSMLQAAMQSVQWIYSLFWRFCPQQGILKWGDGCYNGAIKTRKSTVQAISEVSSEEESLQRSQQLRELYESLSAGDTEPPTRRPCAALSPEELTECEWFYLMCVSFSFSPGVGLPGKAYARRQHVWLAGADQADNKTFARAILAKSARVQTVVCIPLLEGVVEFGTTDKVQEDFDFIELVRSFFTGHHHLPTPKQALSEHSTSASSYPVTAVSNIPNEHENMEMEKHDKEEAELLDTELAETVLLRGFPPNEELMELQDMFEASRVGSPDDGSNLLYSAGLELLQVESSSGDIQWSKYNILRQYREGIHLLKDCSIERLLNTRQRTLLSNSVTILENSYGQWLESPSVSHLASSSHSAFAKWCTMTYNCHLHVPVADTPQWLLKYILFRVPYLHAKQHHHNSPQTPDWGRGPPRHEPNIGQGAAERRRREKLNEKFMTLRSFVPLVTKMDKASILGDTIEYVKQLQEKIRDLEARSNHMMGDDQRRRSVTKRKQRVVETSITEGEALLEVECMQKEGLLLGVMRTLREVGIEVIGVQSSMEDDGVFVAQLKAKVTENVKGKKVSLVEVKKALHRIIHG